MKATGVNGQVEFDGQFVTITRKGVLGRLTVGKGTKRIPVSRINGIQIKNPGIMVNGYIEFTLAGGIERRAQFGTQTFNAAGDENSIIFSRRQATAFRELREAVEQAISG